PRVRRRDDPAPGRRRLRRGLADLGHGHLRRLPAPSRPRPPDDLQGAAARAPAAVHRVRLPHRAGPDLRRRRQRRRAGGGGEADRRGRCRVRGVRAARAQPALARRGSGRGGSGRALGARERAHQGAADGDQDPHRADPHAQPRRGARRAGRTGRRRGRVLVHAPRAGGRAEDRAHGHVPADEAALPDHHRDREPHREGALGSRRARLSAGTAPTAASRPRFARSGMPGGRRPGAPAPGILDLMGARALPQLLLRAERPSRALGVVVALASVAATTLLVYPLKHLAPVQTLGVVYLLPVLVVSIFWGLGFGVGTAILSAAAFNFFHLPPLGDFTLRHGRDWIGLAAFIAVAIVVGLVAEIARARAQELDERRREAALASELAQLLLGAERLQDALGAAAERLAQALGAPAARIRLQHEAAAEGVAALPLQAGGEAIGWLELPSGAPASMRERAREHVVPALASILAAAVHRETLRAEVVETAALRRSDEMKTAVLRSVSHDLRTPVTAILGAAGTLDPREPDAENVGEVRELVLDAGTRLWVLIEKLLDLSLLQSGSSAPRVGWCSLEDVLHEAVEMTGAPAESFQLSIDRELP